MIATLKKVESMEKPHVPMATVAINENTILEVGNWLPIKRSNPSVLSSNSTMQATVGG